MPGELSVIFRRELGKIRSIDLTIEDTNHPYVVVTIAGDNWGTCAHETPVSIIGHMRDAKRHWLSNMRNVPVEVFFVDNRLDSWRVLTEVL